MPWWALIGKPHFDLEACMILIPHSVVILLISFVFTTVYSLFAGFLGFSQFVSGGMSKSVFHPVASIAQLT
jgi:uncharacterized membrane protein (DUF485 family)